MQLIFTKVTPFNEIRVYETNHLFGRTGRFRCLRFADEAIQGAIDLKNPDRVVLEYPRAMMHLMEHNVSTIEHTFMVGLGIGTIPEQYPHCRFMIGEIDEEVAAVSRKYFNCRQDNIVIGDGRNLLEEQKPDKFDCLILDAFTQDGTPQHLTTLEFMQLARTRLRANGILLMNLAGKVQQDWRIASIHTTLAEVFNYTAVYFLPVSTGSGLCNVLLAGSKHPIKADPRSMAGFGECILEQGNVLRDRPR